MYLCLEMKMTRQQLMFSELLMVRKIQQIRAICTYHPFKIIMLSLMLKERSERIVKQMCPSLNLISHFHN